jgi:PKHD-type hydroxylase
MLLEIPSVLDLEQLEKCRQVLDGATWVDGRGSAGHLAVGAKRNQQLAANDPVAIQLGNAILDILGNNARFMAAALPLKILPPMFNRYKGGNHYGSHIDNAIRHIPGSDHRVRTDISATLFLTDPQDYDGGELVIEDTYGSHNIKLPAGHLVIYPGTNLHRVTPVVRGARTSCVFWIQSLVREDAQRTILYELDTAIQELTVPLQPASTHEAQHPSLVKLSGLYHNLVRRWSET